ncbi:hypothetical protein [Streptomyces sp. CT34]|uniref:hypothetical protein n=1 Tax=Streptomyces sp. CT34 TaxID=1553907 RepID=UPI0005BD579D|nr:hypothetical protein [Streptomyces sp. CT34]
MPLRRHARRQPAALIHCQTLLDPQISTTARLLYAVHTASLDEDLDLEHIAHLAGLDDANQIRPFIAELETVGIVDLKDHQSRGEIITVRAIPLVPEERSHSCVPCEDCGACSCEYMKGICRICHEIRRVRAEAKADIARWQHQVKAGKPYAMGANTARLHRWDCKSLNSVDKGLSAMKAAIEHAKESRHLAYVCWPKLSTLYTAEELRLKGTKKRNCALCGPDHL